MEDEYRDERGRWKTGVPNGGPRPGGGRPSESEAERVRAAMRSVLDDETLAKWAQAMKHKIAKGNIVACEFLWDRVLGKPAVNLHHEMDGALSEFMMAWQQVSGDVADTRAAELPANSDGPRT